MPATLAQWAGAARLTIRVPLPNGGELATQRDAIAWLPKKVPKAEHEAPEIQLAARLLTGAGRALRDSNDG